jgi:hypothetical protein
MAIVNFVRHIALIICAALALGAAPAPKPSKGISLPYAGDLLGKKLSDVRGHVYRIAGADGAKFSQKTGGACESVAFILDFANMVAIELDVDDRGVVTKVTSYIHRPAAANAARIEKLLDINDKRVIVAKEDASFPNFKSLLKITFTLVPVEAYLFDDKPSKEVAEGLRKGEFVGGMTTEEQVLVNDGPGVYVAVIADKVDARNVGASQVDPGRVALGSQGSTTCTVTAKSRADAIQQVLSQIDRRRDQIASIRFTLAK